MRRLFGALGQQRHLLALERVGLQGYRSGDSHQGSAAYALDLAAVDDEVREAAGVWRAASGIPQSGQTIRHPNIRRPRLVAASTTDTSAELAADADALDLVAFNLMLAATRAPMPRATSRVRNCWLGWPMVSADHEGLTGYAASDIRVFDKTTRSTPKSVIERCRRRLRTWDEEG